MYQLYAGSYESADTTWLLFSPMAPCLWCIMLPRPPRGRLEVVEGASLLTAWKNELVQSQVRGLTLTWWMQLLLSRHVESGSEQSRLPVIRAVRCFSSSWVTMASTVSVVWTWWWATHCYQLSWDFSYRNLQFAVQIWLLFAKNWKNIVRQMWGEIVV